MAKLENRVAVIAANNSEIGLAVQGNVSNIADLDRLYTQVAEEKGRVDIVFKEAGTGRADNRARLPSDFQREPARTAIWGSKGASFDAGLPSLLCGADCVGIQW